MIPLYDLQFLKRIPVITYSLIGLNMLVFLGEMLLSPSSLYPLFLNYGAIPSQILGQPISLNSLTVFSSLFLHGDWLHLASNMLFLLIFGDDIEDWLGRASYLGFYLVCGVLATLTQIIFYPNSGVPIIGASGAIAGILGAYAVSYAQVPIRCLTLSYFYTRRLQDIPAAWILIIWFAYQLISGILDLGGLRQGIAFFAHLGGFAAGYFIISAYSRRFGRPVSVYTSYSSTWQNFGMMGNVFSGVMELLRRRTTQASSRPAPQIIEFPQGGTARSPQPPRYRWEEDDQMAAENLKSFEADLQDMREKVIRMDRQPPTGRKAQAEFAGLTALEHRARAMKFFNTKKGQVVEVETHNLGSHKGNVISFNSKQVMLRDEDGKSIWIALHDIARVF